MKRYTIPFFIFCAWFYVFKMTPIRFHSGEDDYIVTCGVTDLPSNNPSSELSKGKIAFDANCARCHNNRLEKNSTGPALLGMSQRIPEGDWIYRWIRNSSQLISEGDPYAVKIWEENGKGAMDPFPNLADSTIDDIIEWIDGY